MAKKPKINLAAMIREMFIENPDATPMDVHRKLKAKKLNVASAYISTIRSAMNRKSGERVGTINGAETPTFAELQQAKKLSKMCGGPARALRVMREYESLCN